MLPPPPPPRPTLLRGLRLLSWGVPLGMAALGIAFTRYEIARHAQEPLWPWPAAAGLLLVVGGLGPGLAWLGLRWAVRTAEAYLASQAQLARRNAELAALNRLALAAGQSLDLNQTISTALDEMMQTLDAAAGMVFIQGDGQAGLRLQAHHGISMEMAQKEARLTPGHCLCGQAVQTRQILFTDEVGADVRCTSDLCICEGFRSVACAPLEVHGRLVGVLQLASPQAGHFGNGQRDFVGAMARQVSACIENARLYDTVRSFNADLEQRVAQRTQELEAAREALAEKAHQLQRLLSESYRIQEDTQARIAHDMHDGVTQMIIGALYETQAARQSLAGDPQRAAENLSHAQRLLADVETEIRRVIYDLHPPVLDALGLATAARRFAATFAAAFKIDCEVEVNGHPRRLPRETEVAIYRIVQAALHNVASHAQARRARVVFDFEPGQLRVAVEDDGQGFDPQAVSQTPGEHLGLIGMNERAEGMGAQLEVDSSPGRGARIHLRLPSPGYLDSSPAPED